MTKRSYGRCLAALLCTLGGSPDVRGEVLDVSEAGFTVRSSITVAPAPDRSYNRLVTRVDRWWDPAHTFGGDASRLRIEEHVRGCFCEAWPQGGSVKHLEVVYLDPGRLLRLSGGLGPLQQLAVTGTMSWEFSESGDGTEIKLTYAVPGYHADGLRQLASPVDHVLNGPLLRLQQFLNTGSVDE